jgi:nitroreductase
MKHILKMAFGLLPARHYLAAQTRYRHTRDIAKLWVAAWHDARWFSSHSGLADGLRKPVLQAKIIKSYHRIEKGLALKTPRPGFGADAIEHLIADITDYTRLYGADSATRRGIDTLREYLEFNTRSGAAVPQQLLHLLATDTTLATAGTRSAEGGTRTVHRDTIIANGQVALDAFLRSRHSIRHFAAEPVDEALIEKAVQLAQLAPSVCNREAGRVFLVSERSRIDQLLQFQNGNRGFGEQADKLLVITASLDCFLTVGERYQCWVDGGLFAMTLIYALHAQGLGTCCLNWSVEPDVDTAFKQAAGIAPGQAVIMLLAVGHLPQQLRVAMSSRRALPEVLSRI